MANYEVIFYEKADGTEPAKEFLLSLDPKMRAKMFKTIDLLAENGNDLREPYSKYLEDNIFDFVQRSVLTFREFCIFSLLENEWFSLTDSSRKH